MTKVFVGGSRRFARLNSEVLAHLDRIVDAQLSVLIGDANGADKAVQSYLNSFNYEDVVVYCTNGSCRNNVGNWTTRDIAVPGTTKGYDYYSVKDREMAKEASIGLMLWDGKSIGTLLNVYRLVSSSKRVVVYLSSEKRFVTLERPSSWNMLVSMLPLHDQAKLERRIEAERPMPVQGTLV